MTVEDILVSLQKNSLMRKIVKIVSVSKTNKHWGENDLEFLIRIESINRLEQNYLKYA